MLTLSAPTPDRHSLFEDILGIVTGTTLVALSVQFLRASELITGQIAGLSLVGSYVSALPFGVIFFFLNLPFYILALRVMGWKFTLRSFLTVGLMSILAELIPTVLIVDPGHPAVGAALAGLLAGVGLLVLFRHGATLGGVGIVALWLQDSRGIKAGNTQLTFDLFVFGLAAFLFDPWVVVWSLFGAVILNVIITMNHRRDRYIAK